jgi:hypothetical protein
LDEGPVAFPNPKTANPTDPVYHSVLDGPVPVNAMKIECATINLTFQTYIVYSGKVYAEVDWTCVSNGVGAGPKIAVSGVKMGKAITLLPNLAGNTLYTGKDGGTAQAEDFFQPDNPLSKKNRP